MLSRRLLFAQFLVILPLAVLTWFAVAYALYWRIWWLDIPMHVFGGMWAGLCGAWILARRGHSFQLAWCLAFTLSVGVAWEVFEYAEGIAMPRYLNCPLDTAMDLAMGLVGGALGWLLATRLVGERESWML